MPKHHSKWTLVRHSGWMGGHRPQFRQGLEVREVPDARMAARIEKEGGVLFDTYAAADGAAEKWMYPPDLDTGAFFDLAPRARGTFSALSIDGLQVYLPVREIVG